MIPFLSGYIHKTATVKTPLLDHQQRVVDKIKAEDQPGLVVAHGLGSGKTLTSLAAIDQLGEDASAIVPASLIKNYLKEMDKHIKEPTPKVDISSLQQVARRGFPVDTDTLVVDEAHRMRNPATTSAKALRESEAFKKLLLTGTPFYNHPADLSGLINMAASDEILPESRSAFSDKFIKEVKKKPPIHQRLLNILRSGDNKVRYGSTSVLDPDKAEELSSIYRKWVDYHPGDLSGNFPDVAIEDVKVEMSPDQQMVYDSIMSQVPPWVAYKVRQGMPPSKAEMAQMNAFLAAARQVSNTASPYGVEDSTSAEPKISAAFDYLEKALEDPSMKAVVYSNFIEAGVEPYKRRLEEAGIPYGEFTGSMSRKERDDLVRDYNDGRVRVLIISSAGGEGLDLRGTRLMQILEPHWNIEKIRQVEGRGARLMSHNHLPEDERNVLIQRYYSINREKPSLKKFRDIFGLKSPETVDQYLYRMSERKDDLIKQFKELLGPETSEDKETETS